ncbi:MAG: hypothetical protein WCI27_08775, partial [Candidatus Omnitrophota bacterium]
MKDVMYRKRDLARNRGRVVSVIENVTQHDNNTRVVKNFIYMVTRVDAVPKNPPSPKIRMMKGVDTLSRQERFVFKVKGVVYIKEKRFIFELKYCHSLNVDMQWKIAAI